MSNQNDNFRVDIIRNENPEEDIFVHHSDLNMENSKKDSDEDVFVHYSGLNMDR